MRFACLPFLSAIMLLPACREEAEPARKQRISDDAMRSDVLPVMGAERRIVVVATAMLDGEGLARAETYPARLENALRARGVNAEVESTRDPSKSEAELLVAADCVAAQASIPCLAPRMAVPAALVQGKNDRPDARGVEELVAQSVDQVAAALPMEPSPLSSTAK